MRRKTIWYHDRKNKSSKDISCLSSNPFNTKNIQGIIIKKKHFNKNLFYSFKSFNSGGISNFSLLRVSLK